MKQSTQTQEAQGILELKLNGEVSTRTALLVYPKREGSPILALQKMNELDAQGVHAQMIGNRRLMEISAKIFNRALFLGQDSEPVLHFAYTLKRSARQDVRFSGEDLERQVAAYDLSQYGVNQMRLYPCPLEDQQYLYGFHSAEYVKRPVDEKLSQCFKGAIDDFNRRSQVPFSAELCHEVERGTIFLPPINFIRH